MTTNSLSHAKRCRVLVACRIMQPELERVRKGGHHVEIQYLDQGLHRTPQKMAYVLQEKINEVARYATEVVLGYGLCGNGIAGVTAINQRLIVPRFHDCIGLFFGSQAAYANAFNSRPGTFYLSPGFIAERKDPLSIVEEEYASRVGMQKAKWVMEIELKHYTHIVLINTGVTDLDALRRLRQRTLENVVFFNKQYDEIHVTLDYFEKLISGPYTEEDFFILKPGEKIVQEMFYEGLLAK